MQTRKLARAFIFLFLIFLLIFNWNRISWVFNYRALSGFLSETFKTSEKEAPTSLSQENNYQEQETDEERDRGEEIIIKEGNIEISKLNVFAPIVFPATEDEKELEKSLDLGVVHFPSSALPGEVGQTIILGHSAPLGWPKIKYDWVFSRINELVPGDEISIIFNNKEYRYSVINTVFLERGEEIPERDLTNYKNVVVLISCWPPGKDARRIAVEAEIQ